ncbi:Acid phosphatase 1 [Hordeum vulgare]|nr:Acid phosphatase 1 [Hordeum vulgare]
MDKTARCSARWGSMPSSSLAPPSPPRATGNRPSCRSSSSCPPRRREATRPSSCGAPARGRRGRPTTWRRVRDCVLHVRAYLTGHAYRSDLDLVAREASAYARAAATGDAAAADATQAAWVFDVDGTLLSNLPYYVQHGYGLELFDHREFDRWVETGEAPAIPSSLRQYREVRDLGFNTFLLTGRRVVCSFLIECPVQIIARYAANKSMDGCAFCNADGDFLIVPQQWREVAHVEAKERDEEDEGGSRWQRRRSLGAFEWIRVSINPESKSRAVNREVLSELIKVHGKTSLGGKLPAYDGRKSLYTAGSLPFESEEFSVTLVDPEKKDKEGLKGNTRSPLELLGGQTCTTYNSSSKEGRGICLKKPYKCLML